MVVDNISFDVLVGIFIDHLRLNTVRKGNWLRRPVTMPPLPPALLICLLLYAAAFGVSEASPASASASGDLHRVCPTPCVCDVIGRQIRVDCSYSSLTHVPPALPSNLTHLYLSGNPLERLSRDDLRDTHLRHLEDFQCTDCHLTELQADLFQGFKNLKYIDLSNNDIQDISTDAFDGLPRLRVVNVQSNQRLDCVKMVTAFREKFPRVAIVCVDVEAASSASSPVLSRRRRDDSNQSSATVEDASSGAATNASGAATDASGAAKDPPGQPPEPESGFGVGTIIFITILSVIIFIVCFKFVFLRLKRRFCRGDRHSEEQPLDSD